MNWLFYISGLIAVIATVMVITRSQVVHGLLYLVVSLFAVAMVFLSLGAAFAAALEIIVYAGAIMVLFIFVIMLLNPGAEDFDHATKLFAVRVWILPGILSAILFVELLMVLAKGVPAGLHSAAVNPKDVGLSLFGPYLLGVELASLLLLAGLVGAYHLGGRRFEQGENL